MRHLPFLLLLFSLSCRADPLPDEFELASRLAREGAAQLALAHVEAAQPARADGARWPEWERLRLSLLAELDRPQDVLRRVAELPREAPAETQQAVNRLAAMAALELGQGAAARSYLARLFWQSELTQKQHQEARQLAARSYIAEGRPADAYPVMLRLRQDYSPVAPDLLEAYLQALLQAGLAEQAAEWLPQLNDADPLKLLVRLDAGLLAPQAAVDAARQALQKKPVAANWTVILKAGQLQKNAAWQAEAQEQLIAASKGSSADQLWQAYLAHADAAANQLHLLTGDDAAWSEQANQQAQIAPVTARALLAYLAQRAKDAALRADAQLRLISSLAGQKLGMTAVRLFEQGAANDPAPAARYSLGEAAAQAGSYAFAVRLWQGLDAPPADIPAQQWRLRRAEVLVKGGAYGAGSEALRELLPAREPLAPDAAARVRETALELQDAGQEAAAQQAFQLLLPAAPASMQRDILARLGAMAENRKDYKLAADYFLQAALLPGAPDALASNARFAAAANLARAGFRQDAKAQYQSVLKTSKDAAQQEAARRALSRL